MASEKGIFRGRINHLLSINSTEWCQIFIFSGFFVKLSIFSCVIAQGCPNEWGAHSKFFTFIILDAQHVKFFQFSFFEFFRGCGYFRSSKKVEPQGFHYKITIFEKISRVFMIRLVNFCQALSCFEFFLELLTHVEVKHIVI